MLAIYDALGWLSLLHVPAALLFCWSCISPACRHSVCQSPAAAVQQEPYAAAGGPADIDTLARTTAT